MGKSLSLIGGRSSTILPNNSSRCDREEISAGAETLVRNNGLELRPPEQLKLPSFTPFIMNMLQRHLITVHGGCQRHFAERSEHTTLLLIGFFSLTNVLFLTVGESHRLG